MYALYTIYTVAYTRYIYICIMYTYVHTYTYALYTYTLYIYIMYALYTIYTVALYTIAKTRKQPKCPPMDERIKKMWGTHTEKNIIQP